MRNSIVALAVVVCLAQPYGVPAKEQTSLRPHPTDPATRLTEQLSKLLHQYGIDLVKKARAAECIEEGETCASTDQCCAGLECAGGPPATCISED
jgi:hypothetical protein